VLDRRRNVALSGSFQSIQRLLASQNPFREIEPLSQLGQLSCVVRLPERLSVLPRSQTRADHVFSIG
jgi:hypothetical protein